MRYLLDANLPMSAKEAFSSDDEVTHVREIGFSSAGDEQILLWAKKHGAIVISRDFDFANILLFPPERHSGVVVLKLPSHYGTAAIRRVLKNFLQLVDSKDLAGSVTIVEEGSFRIRKSKTDPPESTGNGEAV